MNKLLLCVLALGMSSMTFAGNENVFDPPVMGWSSWNTYRVNINEALIKKQADAMVQKGLKGFVYGPENILSHVDKSVLGLSHMYNDRGIDPEGVLSTIPSIAQVLIGFWFGKICMETPDMKDKLNRLFLYGAMGLIAGFLLQDVCPLNKKVWSPTFVLVTCGFSALLLSILLWYIDVTKKYQKTWIFAIFGVNPLFCYVLSEILYILADSLPLQEQNMHDIIYAGLSGWLGDNAFTSFVYAFLFVGVVWLVGAYLYKKKIYIKI